MKKRFSVILALVMILAVAVPVMASCDNKQVKEIAVVDPVTSYKVGDSIDYDSLLIKVTYEDDTSDTKTVKALKANVTKADLSKEGNTSYTVSYGGKSVTVNIKVDAKGGIVDDNIQVSAFIEPTFYTAYKTKSAASQGEEARSEFRVKGETYEVGNVNKFIFRPSATGLDLDEHKTITVTNVKTTAKVYSKNTKDGTYTELTGEDLTNFVAIDDNTYKFSQGAAGKYVKLEIAIDAEEYDLSLLEEDNSVITVEMLVVDGGYNVYDQLGLSVMCDMQKKAWAPLWGAEVTFNATTQKYDLSAGNKPVRLEADDKDLYEYVGNVSWVILHTAKMGVDDQGKPAVKQLELNANQMPETFFWSSTDTEYTTALASIKGLSNLESKLDGSLKEGLNDSQHPNYTKDMIGDGNIVAETGIGANMQNGLFASCKVSISGNYNGIIVPKTYKEGERHFDVVVDWGDNGDSKPSDPIPHWSVFQIHMTQDAAGLEAVYDIKNLAMTGNCAKDNISEDERKNGTPAGMMMVNCYSNHLTFSNTLSDRFYTNIVVDAFGDKTGVNIINSKMYDAYSNMCFMWRSKITIENSELIGAGGPLFILSDGNNHFVQDNHTDAEGANMTVDTKSTLQSYATGNESWYATFNATALVGQFTGPLNTLLGNFGKTIVKEQGGLKYVNIIAAIICSPGDLMSGNSNNLIDVCGSFTTKNAEGIVEEFKMHNDTLVKLRAAAQNNAKMFPVILQVGNLFAFTDGQNMFTLDGNTKKPFDPATDGVAWATDAHDKICVYMSAASQSGSDKAPYFGVVLDIYELTSK